MPRRPRVEYPGYHHIINRGVARGNIFLKDDDFLKFLDILGLTFQELKMEIDKMPLKYLSLNG